MSHNQKGSILKNKQTNKKQYRTDNNSREDPAVTSHKASQFLTMAAEHTLERGEWSEKSDSPHAEESK